MLAVEFYPAAVSFFSCDKIYDTFFVKNSLKFDDSNNGDSADDKEDEECEPKSSVSKKTIQSIMWSLVREVLGPRVF